MQVDAHIVGHGCMRIDSLWNLRHRVEVEVGEWVSSLDIKSSFAFRYSDTGIVVWG
jgi:hypothetical protein